jgi:cytochrome c peroxidase
MIPQSIKQKIAIVSSVLLLNACGGDNGTVPSSTASLSAPARLGAMIFNDGSLSASGLQSCATCHNPQTAHAPDNGLSVQPGGAHLDVPGFRATPSLRYLSFTPEFSIDSEGTASGGFNVDGRAATLAKQAARPFLAPHEMANASPADVVAKLQRTRYADQFRAVFGADIFSDPNKAFERITFALQEFEKEDPTFRPFSSKFDQFLAGKATLNAQEQRGLDLFNDPEKGNCGACHISTKGADGSAPLFTDFTFDALGLPRNPRIPATRESQYFDLGVCGPDRTDLSNRTEFCGQFKVPTLRNVATRKVFFHNGVFTTLRDAVRFYVTRDTNPEFWYPRKADGSFDKFNDLPPELRGNVNIAEVPYNRTPGMNPALSEREIDDVVAFLQTLTDVR